MMLEFVPALAVFAFVSSITPGPNNLMLMASGANFGIRRSVPHMLGVALGFMVMLVLVGMGLAGLFEAFPAAYLVLKLLCVAYLLYLAWKIANAAAPDGGTDAGTPMSFVQAAAFQWVNPKTWAMALTAITVYATSRELGVILLVTAVFGAINLPCIAIWTWMGLQVKRWLRGPGRLKLFNYTMAVLLVLSLYPFLVSS